MREDSEYMILDEDTEVECGEMLSRAEFRSPLPQRLGGDASRVPHLPQWQNRQDQVCSQDCQR